MLVVEAACHRSDSLMSGASLERHCSWGLWRVVWVCQDESVSEESEIAEEEELVEECGKNG